MVVSALVSGCGYIGYERIPTEAGAGTGPAAETPSTNASTPSQSTSTSNDSAAQDDNEPLNNGSTPSTSRVDADTVALFDFTDSSAPFRSAVGDFEGVPVGLSAADIGPGPWSDMPSMTFSNAQVRFEIPDDPAWQLPAGSVDFYAWISRCDSPQTFVARDAAGQSQPGHLSFDFLTQGGCVGRTRIQTTSNSSTIYSDPVSLDAWHHVGIVFGPGGSEVWVDGTLVSSDPAMTQGIDGNNEPWFVGATNAQAEPVYFLNNGRIASLRISRVRRDFTDAPLP